MASMVFGAVGSYFAGPIGYTIGSAIGSYLSTPDAPGVEGPRLSDTSVNISSWGASLPILYGTHYVTGNIIWSSDIIEQSSTETQGGKGGAPSQEVTTYSYSMDFAVSLCEGPAVAVPRIWANGKLIKNTSASGSASDYVASASAKYSSAIYLGTSTQEADPVIQSYVGAANTPAYRNTCYIRFDGFQLGEFGNQPPQISAEIIRTASTTVERALYTSSITPSGTFSSAGVVIGFSGGGEFITTFGSDLNSYYAWYLTPNNVFYDGRAAVPLNSSFNVPLTQVEVPARVTMDTTTYTVTTFTSITFSPYGDTSNTVGGTYFTGTTFSGTSGIYTNYWQWDKSQCSQAKGRLILCLRKVAAPYDRVLWCWDFLSRELLFQVDLPASSFGVDHLRILIGDDYLYAFTENDDVIYLDRSSGATITTVATNNSYAHAGSNTSFWLENDSEIWGLTLTNPGKLWKFNPTTQLWSLYKSSSSLNLVSGTHLHFLFYVRNDICVCAGDVNDGTEKVVGAAFNLNAPSDSGEPIADIVDDICTRVGITDANTTGISGNVSGLSLSRQVTARTAIEVLAGAYPFDAVVDSDLKFITRAGSTAETVEYAELGAEVDKSSGLTIDIERQQDIEIPKKVVINFADKTSEYTVNSASAIRIGGNASGTRVLDMTAISMTPDQAAQLADSRLYEAWYGNISLTFSTSWQHFGLEPTDVISLVGENRSYTCQITTKTINNGVLEFVAAPVEATIYTSSVVGGGGIPEQGIAYVGQPISVYLDIPLLQDKDDYPGLYLAIGSGDSGYTGTAIYQGSSPSTITTRLGSIANSATIGFATTALGTAATNRIIETHRTVDITLSTGTLSSTTPAGIRAGENVCLLGGEVLQFMTATSLGSGSWRLSELVRGLKGTENYTSSHVTYENFVFLGTVAGLFSTSQAVGADLYYQTVPFGRSMAELIPKLVSNSGLRTKMLPPIRGRLGKAGSDRILSWSRRTRYDLDKYTYISFPLDAPSEMYTIYIYSDSTRATLVRTLTSTSETVTYLGSMATADFGSMPSTLYWSVAQNHSTYGNGVFLAVSSST